MTETDMRILFDYAIQLLDHWQVVIFVLAGCHALYESAQAKSFRWQNLVLDVFNRLALYEGLTIAGIMVYIGFRLMANK